MQILLKVWKGLEGRKTYILAILGGIVVALKLAHVVTDDTANSLLALLGFGSVAALRASK